MMDTVKATINVTREHIAKGRRADCDVCPVALAVKSALKPEVMVSVMDKTIWLLAPFRKRQIIQEGLDAVNEWTTTFDLHGRLAVDPFSFQLRIRRDFLRAKGQA